MIVSKLMQFLFFDGPWHGMRRMQVITHRQGHDYGAAIIFLPGLNVVKTSFMKGDMGTAEHTSEDGIMIIDPALFQEIDKKGSRAAYYILIIMVTGYIVGDKLNYMPKELYDDFLKNFGPRLDATPMESEILHEDLYEELPPA